MKEKQVIKRILQDNKGILFHNDEEMLRLSDIASMKFHSERYDELLAEYVKNVRETFLQKRVYKRYFFWLSFGMLLATYFLLVIAIIVCFIVQKEISDVSTLISATVSFLTVFIVLPRIITSYLFNTGEEQSMATIIGNMQSFDKEIRKGIWDKQDEQQETLKNDEAAATETKLPFD